MTNKIDDYLILNNLVGTKITIDYKEHYDFNSISNNIIYCSIICNDYTKLTHILDNLKFKLLNGAVIIFNKWYYNIHIRDQNERDIVMDWINSNNCELINFSNTNLLPKESFIFRKKPNTYYWSE
jgi:hypothetical protein